MKTFTYTLSGIILICQVLFYENVFRWPTEICQVKFSENVFIYCDTSVGSIVIRIGAGRGGCPLTPMKQQQGNRLSQWKQQQQGYIPTINGGSKQQESYTGHFGEGLNIKNVPLISLSPII